MSAHPDAELFAYLMGTLSDVDRNRVHLHVSSCSRCGAALAQVGEDAAQLAFALAPVPPAPLLRESLLHSLGEINRFTDLQPLLREHLGCSLDDAQLLIDALDDPGAWDDSHTTGVMVMAVPHGAHARFVRVVPGVSVPHEEGTSPRLLLLQGGCRDAEGVGHHPGEVLQLLPDEHADLVATAGPDLIYLTVEPPEAPASMVTADTDASERLGS
ncbi:MAG TPA: zf-HC2 domain-containing protein [Myxococcota bacterium]|nr:zf-HC2 domain-containing protein [Myxococcota bacterium]